MPGRDAIVVAARRYVGTPYHHQAALAGAGCDCLGLIRGVWRDLYGADLALIRPDQIVAWRGNSAADAISVLRRAVGRTG